MELIKGIKERRSTRKFTDQAVSEEEIREIVSAAAYAPSWKNTQTAHYIAIINQAKKQEIADTCVMGFAGNQRIIGQAPVLIVETTVNMKEMVLFLPPRAHTGSPTMRVWREKLSVWLPGKKVWEL